METLVRIENIDDNSAILKFDDEYVNEKEFEERIKMYVDPRYIGTVQKKDEEPQTVIIKPFYSSDLRKVLKDLNEFKIEEAVRDSYEECERFVDDYHTLKKIDIFTSYDYNKIYFNYLNYKASNFSLENFRRTSEVEFQVIRLTYEDYIEAIIFNRDSEYNEEECDAIIDLVSQNILTDNVYQFQLESVNDNEKLKSFSCAPFITIKIDESKAIEEYEFDGAIFEMCATD